MGGFLIEEKRKGGVFNGGLVEGHHCSAYFLIDGVFIAQFRGS